MRVALRGVYRNRKRLADGTVKDYWTLRGFGALHPLAGDEGLPFTPGSAAFMRAYNEAVEAPRRARTAGTLLSIIVAWQRSVAFGKLAARTKADYTKAVGRIEDKFGTYPLDAVEDPKIRRRFLEWRDDMARSSPRQADAVLGVLRIILEFGRDRGMLSHNHATRPKKVYKADRSDKLWLPPEIAALRAVAPADVRLAFELALGTGQRKGDLLKLAWTAYDGERIRFRQGKRKRLVNMPVTRALKAVLDSTPRRAATILTSNGKPWNVSADGKCSHFDHGWRAAVLAAGADGLHFHDLRSTTCTMLAEASCTPSEIAAVLGWSVRTVNAMLDTYQSRTAALSDSAVAKLERRA